MYILVYRTLSTVQYVCRSRSKRAAARRRQDRARERRVHREARARRGGRHAAQRRRPDHTDCAAAAVDEPVRLVRLCAPLRQATQQRLPEPPGDLSHYKYKQTLYM